MTGIFLTSDLPKQALKVLIITDMYLFFSPKNKSDTFHLSFGPLQVLTYHKQLFLWSIAVNVHFLDFKNSTGISEFS